MSCGWVKSFCIRYSRSPMEFGGMAGSLECLWMACRQSHGLEDQALEEFGRDTLLFFTLL